MPNIKKYNEVQSTTRARFVQFAKNGALLAPFMAVPAFAQNSDLTALQTTATSGTDIIKATVLTLAGVAVTIALIVWGVGKMKPRH